MLHTKAEDGQTEQALDHSFQQILQRAAAPFVLRRFRSLHLLSPFSSHLICCFQCFGRANRVLFCGCCFSFLSLSSFIPILLGKSPTAPPLSVLASSWSRSVATFGDICSLRPPHQQLSPALPLSAKRSPYHTRHWSGNERGTDMESTTTTISGQSLPLFSSFRSFPSSQRSLTQNLSALRKSHVLFWHFICSAPPRQKGNSSNGICFCGFSSAMMRDRAR